MKKVIFIICLSMSVMQSEGKGFWFISVPIPHFQSKEEKADQEFYEQDVIRTCRENNIGEVPPSLQNKYNVDVYGRHIKSQSEIQYENEQVKRDELKWKEKREEDERIKQQKIDSYEGEKITYSENCKRINSEYDEILSISTANYKPAQDVLSQCLSVSNKYDQQVTQLKAKYKAELSFLAERHGLKEGYYNNAKELMTSNDPNMVKTRNRLTAEYNVKVGELNDRTKIKIHEYADIRDKKVKEILDWNKNNVLSDVNRKRKLCIDKLVKPIPPML